MGRRGRGRGGRGRNRSNGGGRGQGGNGTAASGDAGWGSANIFITDQDKHNAEFEEYYKAQDVVPEGEWEAFMAALRAPLPVTFRINGSGPYADHVRDTLRHDLFAQFGDQPVDVDGELVHPPRPLPWYPNDYGWHLNFSRNQLRKLPALEAIHTFVKKANDTGVISRQEAVSMVPPLFLGVQPHHKILDMCAAPGSKTFQLLEALHALPPSGSTDHAPAPGLVPMPPGLVIANDADLKRCGLLTHQLKRMCSPNLLVTNLSADAFPSLARPDGSGADAAGLRLDRVLCDVPCSGDGTLRKSPDIWRRWAVNNGNALHALQVRIALQGARLLAVGGRMVYSTCTFNPIEDEAVVAAVLRACGGAVQLVDVSSHLPHLKRLPGVTTWRVRDKARWYGSWEEAKDVGHRLVPSMFPQPDTEALDLPRCMRFLPHHQDTGGFFVAVLEKVAELPADLQLPHTARAVGEEALPPSEVARASAEAALAAAWLAVDALARGDSATAGAARSAAQRAAGQAGHALAAYRAARRKAEVAGPDGGASVAGQGDNAGPGPRVEDSDDDEEAACQSGGGDDAGMAMGAADADDAADTHDDGTDTACIEAGDGTEGGRAGDGANGLGDGGPPKKRQKPSWSRGVARRPGDGGKVGKFTVEPLAPLEDAHVLQSLREAYGLGPALPLERLLITRSLDTALPKKLYLVSPSVLEVLLADVRDQLRVVTAGLPVFDRQDLRVAGGADPECSYRVTQEGLPCLLSSITKHRAQLGVEDFAALLEHRVLDLPTPDRAGAAAIRPDDGATTDETKTRVVPTAALSDPAALASISAMRQGCVVVELKREDMAGLGLLPEGAAGQGLSDALAAHAPLAVTTWRGKSTLSLMVDKNESQLMLERVEAALKACERSLEAAGPATEVADT